MPDRPIRLLIPLVLAVPAVLPGCASPSRTSGATPDVDLGPVHEALWRGDDEAALAAAEELGWQARRSIEGERARQEILLDAGLRGALVADLRAWERAAPGDPGLAYLEARLLQQRDRQRGRFEALARSHPDHAWIRLGAAAVALYAGELGAARDHLREAPDWPDTRSFRRQLEARLLFADDEPEAALEVLEPGAFVERDRDQLRSYLELARRAGRIAHAERARLEIDWLERAAYAAPRERLDAILARAVATLRAHREEVGFEQLLAALDAELEAADLPAGWSGAPRYTVPWIGTLVQPERDASEAAAWLAGQGRFLLVGTSIATGSGLLYLRDAESFELPWPDLERPALVVIGETVDSNFEELAMGAALFRGFFVRLDLARVSASALAERSAGVDPAELPLRSVPDERPADGELPEDWDLPLRLRALVLAGAADRERAALDEEVLGLLFHEAGHLPEIVDWLPNGPSVLKVLPQVIASWLTTGEPLVWLEYRAQLRALAAAPDPRWLLAEVVARARSETGLYETAYRRLLGDLLEQASGLGYPPLARWDTLGSEEVRVLAQAVLAEEGHGGIPRAVRERLVGIHAAWRAQQSTSK